MAMMAEYRDERSSDSQEQSNSKSSRGKRGRLNASLNPRGPSPHMTMNIMASVASEDREFGANQRADQGGRHDARALRGERSSKLMNKSTNHVGKVRFPGAHGFGGASGANHYSPDRTNNRSKSKPSTEALLEGSQEANAIASAGLYSKLKGEQ